MGRHTALIVDDERIARRELVHLLRECPELEVVGEVASVDEAVEALRRLHPSLVFLDVQMPGASGFELFSRTCVEAHVVFVTAYDRFALRAFEVNALDYLTKPVRPERLRQAVDRYLHHVRPEPRASKGLQLSDSILVLIDRTPRFVKLACIECILAEADYSRLIAVDGPVGLVLRSMKEWERLLPEGHFCRIQRSAIVNCEQVARFGPAPNGGYLVHMKHLEQPLTMSRRCARRFRSRLAV